MPAFNIEVRNRDGQVVRADGDRFLLDELEAAGLKLPYGCRFGACLTCAASVIEGSVDQSDGRSFALRPHQQAAGYALLCVAKPRSDCTLEVGVRRDLYVNQFRLGTRPARPAAGRNEGPAGSAGSGG